MSKSAIIRLLFAFSFPLCAAVIAQPASQSDPSGTTEQIQLDPERFNRALELRHSTAPAVEVFNPLDYKTWQLAGLQKYRAWAPFALIGFLLLIYLARKTARPDLRGLPPDTVFKRLERMFTASMGEEELEAFASACAKKGALYLPLARKLSQKQLGSFIEALYIAGSDKLFAEAVFLDKEIFAACPQPGAPYGALRWTGIARLPDQSLITTARWLETHRDTDQYLRFVNALSRRFAADGQKNKTKALLLSVPPAKMQKTSWEILLENNAPVTSLPPQYLEAIPPTLLGPVAVNLLKSGDTVNAQKLMTRLPRANWRAADFMAYFMIQAELDPELARDFYPVFREKVPLAANPEQHYEAAQFCENTGHAELALEIYRHFITENVNYRQVSKQYEALRHNMAVSVRSYYIMMTDMEGYSAKTAAETPEFMMSYLKTHNDIVTSIIREYRGRIIKTLGDSFLAVFESGTAAVSCAVKLQKELKRHNEQKPAREAIKIRVVIHSGEVSVAADGDIYGEAVNITAHMETIAQVEEIWISDAVFRGAAGATAMFQPEGMHKLKGAASDIMLYRCGCA